MGANRRDRPKPVIEELPGGLTRTTPHIKNSLDCLKGRQQPNATMELGHQAVRPLHLANIAYHKKARAALSEDWEDRCGEEAEVSLLQKVDVGVG